MSVFMILLVLKTVWHGICQLLYDKQK